MNKKQPSKIICTLIFSLLFIDLSNAQSGYPVIYPTDDFPKNLKTLIDSYNAFYYYTVKKAIKGEGEAITKESISPLFDEKVLNDNVMTLDFPPCNTETEINSPTVNIDMYASRLRCAISDIGFLKPEIKLTQPLEIIRAKQDSKWFIWIQKSFTFKRSENAPDSTLTTFSKLTIAQSSNNPNEFKIYRIDTVSALPKDTDKDFIADFDEHKNRLDRDLKPLKGKDEFVTIHGIEKRRLEHKLPASRFTTSFQFYGIHTAFNTKLKADKDFVGGNVILKPNYFSNDLGYATDLNIFYTTQQFVSLGCGFMYTIDALNTDKLGQTINSFLASNGSNVSFTFIKVPRELYIPHINIKFGKSYNIGRVYNKGNFYKRGFTSYEFMLGIAFPTQLSKSIDYKISSTIIDSAQGPLVTTNDYKANFHTSPFLVYGFKFNYENIIDHEGNFRIIFSPYLLTGKYQFNDQEIQTPTGNKIIFKGSQLWQYGFSLGISYNILSKYWKEQQEIREKELTTKL